jgi:tetratricopeptide (TPR) repeat protein
LREDDESEARLAKLESLHEAGRFDEAITLGKSMCDLPGSTFVQGRIRLHLAMAYLQLGEPDLAKAPLAEAKGRFEAINDAEMMVQCMAAEASVACLEQRPDAPDLAMKALVACRSLRKVPNALEVRVLSALAAAQLLVGQTREAIRTFEDAIQRADPVVDMRRLAKLLGNAGIACRELGQLDKAIGYSTRAVALFETLRDLVSLAREENNLGCCLIDRGELTSARSHLVRALELFEQTNLLRSRGLLLLSLCELCLAEGNLDQAMTYADDAILAGESQGEAWSVADARMWKGRIAARVGDDTAADDEFQRALAILETSGMTGRLVQCHTGYAEILERRGDLPRAYGQLKTAFQIASVQRHHA